MTRPKDLPAALQSWGTGNYSAGPSWGGTPQRTVPGASFLTPGVTLPAQVENYLHGNAFDAAQGTIDFIGQHPAHNWGAKLAMTGARACAWDPSNQRLWLIGAIATTIAATYSENLTTQSANQLTAPSTETAQDGAVDATGNLVVSTSSRYVYEVNGTSFAGTKPDVGASASAVGFSVQFEPVSGRYVWIGYDGTNTVAKYSTNRTAWTAGGTLVAGNAAIPYFSIATHRATGVILAFKGSSTSPKLYKSTNGGAAWTSGNPITLGSALTLASLYCDEDSSTWYATFTDSASKAEVWKSSDDGATWYRITLLAASALLNVVAVGAMLVGLYGPSNNKVVYSVDAGVTWRPATMHTETLTACLFRAPNFLVIPMTDSSLGGFYISARFGKSSGAALT